MRLELHWCPTCSCYAEKILAETGVSVTVECGLGHTWTLLRNEIAHRESREAGICLTCGETEYRGSGLCLECYEYEEAATRLRALMSDPATFLDFEEEDPEITAFYNGLV